MRETPFLVLFIAISMTRLVGQSIDTPVYNWSKTGPLQVARVGACAVALQDGRILVAGGQGATGALQSVELYQQDGGFTFAADMVRARTGHTCTSLFDGRILVAGGLGEGPAVQAEIYDPATNTWTPAENGTERWNHTATLLPDGRVLLAGGETGAGPTGLLEWLNPATNRIRALPSSLSAARTLHGAGLLPDGSVLVSGGWNTQSLLDSVEIVKLDGSVQTAATLPAARAGHSATSLDNGCVLIAGGVGADGDSNTASLYCADSGTFQPAANMSVARFGHLALRLPNNGKVLIVGGFSQGEVTAASELYDPDANMFLPAGMLTLGRLGMAAAADPTSGTTLAVGGATADGPVAACGLLRSPTVVFDKTRYLDGDVVTVSGLTWTPGETVKLAVTIQGFARPGQVTLTSNQNFQTVASALGRIQQTLFTASAPNAGATFRITATGITSGLTASTLARQVSRTDVTLNVSPSPALTRQPVRLQAIVQPVTSLDVFDGTVNFLLGSNPLGSVSSTGQVINVSPTGQITDGTSNTFQLGESAPTNGTGFSNTFTAPDGSLHTLNPGGMFQLVTRDIPAGSVALSANGSLASVTGSYAPIASLYAPNSATATVSVQKRTVTMGISPNPANPTPRVGDPITLLASVNTPQQPLADMAPTGVVHVNIAPGTVLDAPLVANPATLFEPASGARGLISFLLPAGTRTFSSQYEGDSVYLPGSVSGAASVTVGKGTAGFSLIPGKSSYTVGEQITLVGRIQHPKVVGATPTGQITRAAGPAQFQGAPVGADPKNTGTIDTNLTVTGFPSPGNVTVAMTYGGDANFLPVNAGAILTITKAVPQITLIPPAQVVAGAPASFVVRISPAPNAPPVSGQVSLSGVANGSSVKLVADAGSSVGIIRQTFPAAGTFTISAQYAGDTNYLAATSATVQVVVQ